MATRRRPEYEASFPPPSDPLPHRGHVMPPAPTLNGTNALSHTPDPSRRDGPQKAARIDLDDPIHVHLLTETALSDSKGYQILTQEEVDELKRQSRLLAQRLESTRANLAIQSKYRDAAVSMSKLYHPTKAPPGHRPDDRGADDVEREKDACEQRCRDLAAELFNLEKRLMGPQRRLLEHTAAILQLTHKASRRKTTQPPTGHPMNGIPGSPESLYTFSHDRNSLDQATEDISFDDPSLYRLDSFDAPQDGPIPAAAPPRQNSIEIPMKSPIRGEVHNVREENARLRSQTDALIKRLQTLNHSLRETIVRFDPEINAFYADPPDLPKSEKAETAELLKRQMDYLESGLVAIQAEQDSSPPLPGSALPAGAEAGPLLVDLWTAIQSDFAKAKTSRRQGEKGLGNSPSVKDKEDGEDENDPFDPSEPFSLDGFSSRVRWLCSQASRLRDEKYILKRQMELQRQSVGESENSSETAQMLDMQRELDQARRQLAEAQRSQADESAMEQRNSEMDALETKLRALQEDLEAADLESRQTGQQLAEAKSQLAVLTQEKLAAEALAQGLQKTLSEKESKLSAEETSMRKKEEEMDDLNRRLAELKTELTIARAELDGAYGSRAERAADAAALRNSAELARLQDQTDTLKRELGETVKELEAITKETIAAEREKVELEARLDDALAARAALEAEVEKSAERLTKLEEELDGERLRVAAGAGPGGRMGAGASMLSEQFRATMREERKKFQDDLKEERAKCRKLEDELNRLRRTQGPGRSPLSPR